jgi:hypothetical protein
MGFNSAFKGLNKYGCHYAVGLQILFEVIYDLFSSNDDKGGIKIYVLALFIMCCCTGMYLIHRLGKVNIR